MSGAFLMNLVIQLVAGAVGGNVAGMLLKQYNLGPVGNSIAGIIGGGLGGQLLNMMLHGGGAPAAGGFDIGSILTQIVGGGIGGGILMVIVGLIRQAMGGHSGRA
jgi:uncharacterized membrane protein YeaQ/YmgE (transglycosylase-associated protein family)